MWYRENFFKYAAGAILVLLIIFLLGKIGYFLTPFGQIFSALFIPVLISGFLFYLFRPFVDYLEGRRMPRTMAILFLFALLTILMSTAGSYLGTLVQQQFTDLAGNLQESIQEATKKTDDLLQENQTFFSMQDIEQRISSTLRSFITWAQDNIGGIVSAFASAATTLTLVPFILFYFLRDSSSFPMRVVKPFPDEYKSELTRMLQEMDYTISAYVKGQALVAAFVGVFIYLGFLLIGLDFAFILALFAMFTNVVPFLGPFIGAIPALFIALTVSPVMALKAALVTLVVQQLEGNILQPKIMGDKLDIHPLTVIMLVVAAGAISGFVGLLVAVPVYAVGKIILFKSYRIYKFHHTNQLERRRGKMLP
ncbi:MULTISPECIES: AI-2E family transporter [Paenibacillus]|uniref:AI-2E family transporter n=1 Tax=Paenibacillus TaxID=44249 RepID=UPI0022B938CB|nr:AI-2E family transporter [Paenibacillus caseinilyticus]MCZ8520413.1 AI-2E family transporter [Paenibacillus caseinilyticus]